MLDVPQGPGFPDGDETWVIHKIVEMIIDLNLDSLYSRDRNRVKVFDTTDWCLIYVM